MKISQKLAQAHSGSQASRPTYSFEYFVPKTTQGVQNLYDRMDRMYDLGPAFIDVTWNAGGSTESPSANNLTTEIVATAQGILGLETCMHLTCTGMPKETVEAALEQAYKAGCQNILALRGDKAEGKSDSDSDKDTFIYAKDLIRFIRNKYGDYFDICVAGYPEGHPEEPDPKVLIKYLKEKSTQVQTSSSPKCFTMSIPSSLGSSNAVKLELMSQSFQELCLSPPTLHSFAVQTGARLISLNISSRPSNPSRVMTLKSVRLVPSSSLICAVKCLQMALPISISIQ